MTEKYYLANATELEENTPKEFEIVINDSKLAGFILRFDGELYAYLNHCPHLGVPLNWQPDSFMSLDASHIQCSTHGALFNPDDGLCVSGPCRGEHLTQLNIELTDHQDVYLIY